MKTTHRKSAKAKHHRLKIDQNAHLIVIRKFQPFTPAEVADLLLPPMLAWQSLRNGTGTAQDFATLADTINVALARSESIDATCVETCNLAIQGILRANDRHERLGRYGFDGPALQDIGLAIDLFRQILETGSPQVLFDAINRVKVRIRAGDFYALEGAAA